MFGVCTCGYEALSYESARSHVHNYHGEFEPVDDYFTPV